MAPRTELAFDDDGGDDVEAPGFGSAPKVALAFWLGLFARSRTAPARTSTANKPSESEVDLLSLTTKEQDLLEVSDDKGSTDDTVNGAPPLIVMSSFPNAPQSRGVCVSSNTTSKLLSRAPTLILVVGCRVSRRIRVLQLPLSQLGGSTLGWEGLQAQSDLITAINPHTHTHTHRPLKGQ